MGEQSIPEGVGPHEGRELELMLAGKNPLPAQFKRRGVEMRMVLKGTTGHEAGKKPDSTLLKSLVRGRAWFEALASGRANSVADIARDEGCTPRYVARLLPLAFLAPEIVEAILTGNQPVDLTAETLLKRIDIPLDWRDQKALLGFL